MKPELPFGDVADAEALSALWRSIEEGRPEYRRRRALGRLARRGAVAVGLAALAVIAVGLAARDERLQPLAVAVAPRVTGQLLPGRLGLSDGSSIVVAEGALLEVVENSGPRLLLHLQRGEARFEVKPGTGRQWQVQAGEVAVEVVGTVFVVRRTPEGTHVAVEHGTVLVRGEGVPDGLRRLSAGQREDFAARPPAMVGAGAPPVEVQSPEVAPPPAAPVRAPAPSSARPAAAVDRFAKADAQRRAGDVEGALATLEELVANPGTAQEAGLAAFTAARLVEGRGQQAAAVRWYQRALQLGLPADLAESANAALARPAP